MAGVFDPKNMTDDEFQRHYPGWHIGPNGEEKIFKHPDDVPEGWRHKRAFTPDQKPSEPSGEGGGGEKPPESEKSATQELFERFGEKSRDEIKQALTDLSVEFKDKAKTETLAAVLLKAVDEAEDESEEGGDSTDDNQ